MTHEMKQQETSVAETTTSGSAQNPNKSGGSSSVVAVATEQPQIMVDESNNNNNNNKNTLQNNNGKVANDDQTSPREPNNKTLIAGEPQKPTSFAKKAPATTTTTGKPPRNPTPPRDMHQQNPSTARQYVAQKTKQGNAQPQQQQQQQQGQSQNQNSVATQNPQNSQTLPQQGQQQFQNGQQQQQAMQNGQQSSQVQNQFSQQSTQQQGISQAPNQAAFSQQMNQSQQQQQQQQSLQQAHQHQEQPQHQQSNQQTSQVQGQYSQQNMQQNFVSASPLQPPLQQQVSQGPYSSQQPIQQQPQSGRQLQSQQQQYDNVQQQQLFQQPPHQTQQQQFQNSGHQQQQTMQQTGNNSQPQHLQNNQHSSQVQNQYSQQMMQQNVVSQGAYSQQIPQQPQNNGQQGQGYNNIQPNQQQQQQQQQSASGPASAYTPQQPQSAQEQSQLPQLAIATDQQQLRKQLEEQGKNQQPPANNSFRPVQQTTQIVGMVGTTPIVKIQGTAGHVVKKKKGRFKLLEEVPAANTPTPPPPLESPAGNEATTAPAPALAAAPVSAVVVAGRERTLSNGSAMSQITSVTHHANPQTFDGTGAPVVKKKGRFMVTNVKNPGLIAVQLAAQPAPAPNKVEVTQQQQQQTPTVSQQNIHGSPSHQQNRSDPPLQGTQLPAQDQQQLQNGPAEILIPAQQQVILTDNSMAVQVLPASTVQQHLVYPAQMIQTPVQQAYLPMGQGGAVMPDTPTQQQYQQQSQVGGASQMTLQQPVGQTQPLAALGNQSGSPVQDSAKQGQSAPEEPVGTPAAPAPAATTKQPKQPQGASVAQAQPPRNKQRNLVAPRNVTGYSNGAGLGKVFYFLDQMKNEVTEADRTIKTLQKDMKFMREKNKELEARNRDLERRLREEQALREAAQAKLRQMKRKGRDEKTGAEVEDGQRKSRPNDSPEKAPLSHATVDTKKAPPNSVSGKAKVSAESQTSQQQQQQQQQASKQARVAGNQNGATKPAARNEPAADKQKAPKPSQPLVRKADTATAESTIAGRNLAQLEGKKGNSAAVSKQTKQNGKPLPVARQGTLDNAESKATPTAKNMGQLAAPDSPSRPKVQATMTQQIGSASKTQDALKGGVANGSSNVATRTSAAPPGNDTRFTISQPGQRPAATAPKIPSAIEFDPLKSGPPAFPGLSLDANGRSTPIDSQSVSSGNAAFTSADVGLGNSSFSLQNQYSQPFEVSSAVVGHSQMAFPVVGITPAASLMSYQQSSTGFPQGAAMMQVTHPSCSQPLNETPNGALASNLSLLQQPFLQVSSEQPTSVHSMPVADLSQPMILIQPQHVRGVTMHNFSVDAMLRNQSGSNMQNHHTRGNSLHTLPNVNANTWNQSSQWAPMSNTNVPHQQPQSLGHQVMPSMDPDPFDELVTRRPMSTMSTTGES
ncbi:secreted protein [Seminavis robusta]|uniref:Secreted protein n=1 Tax=Seminavis robusta TaxID=568900 RepID=A0A9N8DYW4_9STRA|nr:secreted protein [Seminavis robusta]|eukprot:Sro486_g152560.1 secreted protein (1409) ;mRNA; r:15330-19848